MWEQGATPVRNAQRRNGYHVSGGLEEQIVSVLVEHRLRLQLHAGADNNRAASPHYAPLPCVPCARITVNKIRDPEKQPVLRGKIKKNFSNSSPPSSVTRSSQTNMFMGP